MKKNDMIFHFGKKALNDAMRTGKSQIFLSSSVAESEVINACVARLARREGLCLKKKILSHYLMGLRYLFYLQAL